jgi:hypothetical protein
VNNPPTSEAFDFYSFSYSSIKPSKLLHAYAGIKALAFVVGIKFKITDYSKSLN